MKSSITIKNCYWEETIKNVVFEDEKGVMIA